MENINWDDVPMDEDDTVERMNFAQMLVDLWGDYLKAEKPDSEKQTFQHFIDWLGENLS